VSLVRELNQLIAEVGAAHSKADVPGIVVAYEDLLDSLSPRTREQINAVLQAVIAELPD
jgi:hypothetical protein